jgi:hypothetical protein
MLPLSSKRAACTLAAAAVPPPNLRRRLSLALSPETLAELLPQLEPVELIFREVLEVPEQPM